jgi:hypothetical protein
VDGLLLTRRQRLRSYWEKAGIAAAPSLVLALVALGLGLWVDAIVIAAIAIMAALGWGSSARTRKGALILGLVVLGGCALFLFVMAWLISHPIQKGD